MHVRNGVLDWFGRGDSSLCVSEVALVAISNVVLVQAVNKKLRELASEVYKSVSNESGMAKIQTKEIGRAHV